MTELDSSTVSTTDAINAMRQRGIDDPESLVSCTTADRIVRTCKWWDGLSGVTKGLLVKRIREGGVDDAPVELSTRDRFAAIVQHYPEGEIPESHKRMASRCWPEDEETCTGAMVVIDRTFPSLSVRCDVCGFEAAYPFKALAAGVIPTRPPVPSRPVPDPQPMVPPEQWRRPADHPSTRDLHPPRLDERSLRWRR